MGLMGTDLPIERAADQLSSKLKPLGYVFALNRNGYVVFHPGLKPQVADVEDPPKLDWLDLEFDVGGRKTEVDTFRLMAIVIPPDHHLYLGADDGAQLAVSKDASGVFSVDNVPIVKLLTTARVFLPVACIDLEFESITSQFDSFASITLPAAATEATPSAPPEGGMNTVGTSVMETVNYNEAGHLSAANMTESEPVLDFLSKIFHKRDVSSYTERSVLLNENSCKAMNHSAECMVQLQPTDSQSETTAGVTPVSIAVDVTTATTSRITVSAEASQLLTDKGVSTTDISNLELFLDQVQRLSQNPSEVITRILFDLIVAEVDVTQYYVSGSLESPVRSRTILLNSGLAWTIPIEHSEVMKFHFHIVKLTVLIMLCRFRVSFQEPEPVSAMVNSSYLLNETDVERELYSESTSLSDRTDLFLDLETDDLNVTDTSTHNVSLQTSQPIPVTVFKAIEIPETPTPFKVGVMGLTLEPEFFPHLLRQVPECSEDSSKVCYLLEDAAYIVAVNDESLSSHIGRFLGYMDPPLMHALLENHVYDVVKDYSMQAICTPVEGTIDMESTGYRSRSVEHTQRNNHEPYSCIQLTHRYFVPRPGTPIPDQSTASTRSHFSIPVRLGTLSCFEDCQRDWTVRDIDGTNLKLLIADPRCSHCGDLDEKLPRDPVEDSGPDVCREAVNPRYRRLLDKCLSSSLQTDPPKCAAFRSVGQFVHVLTMTVLLFAHRCLFL
ncbi:hypothetical protein AHF37_00401 [Paragonimus kellicotti]|nr:hypothetical protein AHF37_00401 [Paragonimus kellicotti]